MSRASRNTWKPKYIHTHSLTKLRKMEFSAQYYINKFSAEYSEYGSNPNPLNWDKVTAARENLTLWTNRLKMVQDEITERHLLTE